LKKKRGRSRREGRHDGGPGDNGSIFPSDVRGRKGDSRREKKLPLEGLNVSGGAEISQDRLYHSRLPKQGDRLSKPSGLFQTLGVTQDIELFGGGGGGGWGKRALSHDSYAVLVFEKENERKRIERKNHIRSNATRIVTIPLHRIQGHRIRDGGGLGRETG